MSLALKWMLEAALLLALWAGACRLRQLWHSTRARVMHYPGPYALATYWALEAIRWMAACGVLMIAAVSAGWGGVAVVVLTIAIITQVVALCSVGLMLPMIAVAPSKPRNSAHPG